MAESRAEADAEALRELEQRLQRATAAAERLLARAAAGPSPAGDEDPPASDAEVPPAGWQWRMAGDPPPEDRWIGTRDAERLFAVLAGVLENVPADLRQRLVAALRELLIAVRALIDWCLERAERRRTVPVDVQDIPIL